MMKKEKINLICEYLDTLFSDPKCELNYSKDYELLIAVMLSAQTTDKRVNEVTKIIFEKYPTLAELKDAKLEDITSIIRPLGTYQRKASYLLEIANILYYQYDGVVPNDRDKLEAMPGVGRKVANVVLSEWFKEPSIAVDTHVDRVSKRLRLAKVNDSVLEVEKKLQKTFPVDDWSKRHLQLVLFGRYYCKSQKPLCDNCRLKDICKK
ncbi:MAG: endonuclease III [Tenericutes bacterium]|nr:endonuclease III [Mycoplasmatota bacterium]